MNADLLQPTDQRGVAPDPAPPQTMTEALMIHQAAIRVPMGGEHQMPGRLQVIDTGPLQAAAIALRLGEAMMGILTQKHGAATARDFANAITAPTTPCTPERAKQDDAWAALQRRLLAASGAGE